jgi:two-component system cell cycle response regulator
VGARILIVEDNVHDLALIDFLLSAFGHVPLRAVDGPEGVELALEERPDLILMDIILPLIDGFEAMRLIRAEPELDGVPVVALTILGSPVERRAALSAGFDGFIVKPIAPESFVDEVDAYVPEALRSNRAPREQEQANR